MLFSIFRAFLPALYFLMRFRNRSTCLTFITLLFALLPAPATSQETSWKKDLAAWRAQHLAELSKPDGWLSLTGLEWLQPGDNSLGSATDNKIHLAAGSPAHLAILHLEGETVSLNPPPGGFPPDFLVAGVPAKLQPLRAEANNDKVSPHLTIATLVGTSYDQPVPGAAEFTLAGKTFRIEPVLEDPAVAKLFFILRDTTSTSSTYPANLFSISIAWKILPALTLLFPPARFRRPAIASPLHCPSAKNAIMIRGLSIFPLAVHFEILCRLSHNRCDTNQWIIWTPIYLPGIPTPLPARNSSLSAWRCSSSTKHSSTWSAATTSASMAPSTPASSSAWSSTTRNSPGFTTSPNSLSALTKRSPPRSLSRPSTPPRPLLWRGKCLSPRNQATISRKNISTPSNAIPPSSLSTPNSPDFSTTSRPTPQVPNFSRIP